MRAITLALVLSVAALSGCGTMRVETSRGPVYVGMSNEQIVDVLGAPDSIGRGWWVNYGHDLFVSPGSDTIEWAWKEPRQTVVAYLDYGIVYCLYSLDPE